MNVKNKHRRLQKQPKQSDSQCINRGYHRSQTGNKKDNSARTKTRNVSYKKKHPTETYSVNKLSIILKANDVPLETVEKFPCLGAASCLVIER